MHLRHLLTLAFLASAACAIGQPSLVPPLGTVTGITEINTDTPIENLLQQNSPNPSFGSTIITFSLKESGIASIKLYDTTGKLVATLIDQRLEPGTLNLELQTSSYPQGIYFYQLSLGQNVIGTKRMIIIDQ